MRTRIWDQLPWLPMSRIRNYWPRNTCWKWTWVVPETTTTAWSSRYIGVVSTIINHDILNSCECWTCCSDLYNMLFMVHGWQELFSCGCVYTFAFLIIFLSMFIAFLLALPVCYGRFLSEIKPDWLTVTTPNTSLVTFAVDALSDMQHCCCGPRACWWSCVLPRYKYL